MDLPKNEDPDRDARTERVTRELAHLVSLHARRRLRVRLFRVVRGTMGAGVTLATLIKLKRAGSPALKLGIAVLVGLGLAWPFVVLAVVALVRLVLALVSLFDGGSADCPDIACGDGCERRGKAGGPPAPSYRPTPSLARGPVRTGSKRAPA